MAVDNFDDIKADPTKKTSSGSPISTTAGQKLSATIFADSWDNPGETVRLVCGKFDVSGVKIDGPPSTATIEAASIPLNTPIRLREKSRGWEGENLSSIANQIAADNGLWVKYELDEDPFFDRIDQREQADLPFLKELCDEQGAILKVMNNAIIIYDEAKLEAVKSKFTFKRGDKWLLSYSFTQDSTGVAEKATAVYKDPKTGQKVTASVAAKEFFPDYMAGETFSGLLADIKAKQENISAEDVISALSGAASKEITTNTRPNDLWEGKFRAYSAPEETRPAAPAAAPPKTSSSVGTALPKPDDSMLEPKEPTETAPIDDFNDIRSDANAVAKQRAQKALRAQNRNEWKCDLTLVGNPKITAGITFEIEGFGKFDAKYLADSVSHTISGSGYTTSIKAHKVLGY